jgi:cytochrome c-type biogenesis protein CcmH
MSQLGAAVPGNAILFVFIHPNGARGMPVAVKRLPARGFPMSLNFSDADLLNPGLTLESFEKLDVSARVSMAGTVMKATGDYEANVVTIDTKAVSTIALHLDQRVP